MATVKKGMFIIAQGRAQASHAIKAGLFHRQSFPFRNRVKFENSAWDELPTNPPFPRLGHATTTPSDKFEKPRRLFWSVASDTTW
jgi:hypothetical protein